MNRKKINWGFSLAEAMLAMLFISIGLFAYVSLHTRIIHSNFKLEARQLVKEKIATDMASKCAKARQGQTTTSGISNVIPPANVDGGSASSSPGSSSPASSFPSYSPYNTNTGYADSQAMKDSNAKKDPYPVYDSYKNSKPVDAPGVLEGGFTIAYDEGQRTTNPVGLPPGLNLVQTTAPYDDRNGHHTYYVDCYERTSLTRW